MVLKDKREILREKIRKILTPKEIHRIVRFEEDKPYEILGPHLIRSHRCVVIRAFLPRARSSWVKEFGDRTGEVAMEKIHPAGLYQALFEETQEIHPYTLRFEDETGFSAEFEDPYAFPSEITDFDLYLIEEGTHNHSYEKFGAKPAVKNGVSGIHFAVWAPNARSVSVVGNFNHWTAGEHPMSRIRFSGVWGLFIPRLAEGEVYKFAMNSSADHQIHFKTDPYAFRSELRPRTASIVAGLDHYEWNDNAWLDQRKKTDPLVQPVSIYEVHLGSWKKDESKAWGFLNYRTLAHQMVEYVKYMGYTHIELLPVMEHPLDESWGYQVVNFYAPSSRYGAPEDLMFFVDHCHQNGIGVILDWVPAHFPKDSHGLANFDGREIYAYENWKKGEHKAWGTKVFDFGKKEVCNFLISNALFWLEKYHMDGLRVDAVAAMLYLDYSREAGEWEPNIYGGRENLEAVAFLKKFNEIVHSSHPGVLTIAEESTAWPGVSRPTYMDGLGFSMKWNMGWMHDTLEYFSKDPVHRKFHQSSLTFSLWYAFTENFVLPISHDEVVHGKKSLLEKMPGDDWQKFANVRLFLGYMFVHPGKKLLFMGSDFGHRSEWQVSQSMDWHLLQYDAHQKIHLFLRDLQQLYRNHRALYEGDYSSDCFEWIDFSDSDTGVMSAMRWSKDKNELLVFSMNMTPVLRQDYRIGVPKSGFYQELLNSDALGYGGSGAGNFGGLHADAVAWHGRDYSLKIVLPPLSITIFRLNI